MSNKQKINNSNIPKGSPPFFESLVILGPVLVVVGAILYSFQSVVKYGGWLLISGGIMGAIGLLVTSVREKVKSPRIKRLNRMSFLAFLLFMVAGGFMVQGSGTWFPLLAVGTVFYVYSVFAENSKLKKEKMQ